MNTCTHKNTVSVLTTAWQGRKAVKHRCVDCGKYRKEQLSSPFKKQGWWTPINDKPTEGNKDKK